MFWFKRKPERSLQGMLNDSRLAEYDWLLQKLREYDWFEFNSAGGIIAHKKDEPTDGHLYGNCFTVPYELLKVVEE